MKTYRFILLLTIISFFTVACTHKVVIVKKTPAKSLPPGQAKKLTGSTSAKPYAPGQQKKKQ